MVLKAFLGASMSLGAAGAAGFLAAAQTTAPEGLWPTTVAGWLALFLSLCSCVGIIYTLHRFSLKPVTDTMLRMERHFDDKISAVQQHYDEKIDDIREEWRAEFNNFTVATNDRLNGFGGRVADQQIQITRLQETASQLTTLMAQSAEDRRHINAQLNSILGEQGAARTDRQLFERQMLQMVGQIARSSVRGGD
jgi:hypothetical protein